MVFFLSVLAATLPIVVYILFLRWLDRYEREPITQILIVFGLGAVISTFFSYVANSIVSAVSYRILTYAGSEFFTAGIVAPFVEEINKGLIVVGFAWFSKEFDNLTDGLLYGAVVGLGFAFTENIMFLNRVYAMYGQFVWLDNIYTRSFFSAGLHASATAIFGASIAIGKYMKTMEKVVIGFIGLVMAMCIHSFWNTILTVADLSRDNILSLLPFFGLFFIYGFIFILFQASLYREHQLLETELTKEADLGTIDKAHVPFLKSYIERGKTGWLPAGVNKDEYIHLATDLAFRRWQVQEAQQSKKAFYEKELNDLRAKITKLLGNTGTPTTA